MMNRDYFLLILIYCYSILLVKTSSFLLVFDIDEHVFEVPHYVNENFSIGATFTWPSSYSCSYTQCLTNLKLKLRKNNKLSMNIWCTSPAIQITNSYENIDELSCVINGINATAGSYHLSAMVQVYAAGSFIPIFSVIFPDNPDANQEWLNKEIIVLNSSVDGKQFTQQQMIKRNKRQSMATDDTNVQTIGTPNNVIDNGTLIQIQTMSINDGSNMNQPLQLNIYNGSLNPGYTADLTCNGAGSCPNYPKTDEQGRPVCCFSLPQTSDGTTALSSVIYQNGLQNLNDYQVNVGNGQTFNAGNDLNVFFNQIIPTVQCNIVLPTGSTQSNGAQFRLTWTYHSNSPDNNLSSLLPSTTPLNDGTLPVNVLRVTSTSAYVQQGTQYNEWFVCPPSQNGQISILRSIALLSGNNIAYFRCIYVNNQGIPLQDPTTSQLLVFSSTKNSALDNPTITTLPNVHTDCISIQFFPNPDTSIDLNSIVLSITIAFQTVPTTDMSSVMPQVSNLQGTNQIQIDITIDMLSVNDNNVLNSGPTNVQTPVASPSLSSSNNNLPNPITSQCNRYQNDVPMSYNNAIRQYTGTYNIPSQYSQQNIIDSVTVTGSSSIQNPITMLLVDSQGNTLSSSYSLTSGNTFKDVPKASMSKIILQVTPLQDAPMDSTLRIDTIICPSTKTSADVSAIASSSSVSSPQANNQINNNAVPSAPISNIAPSQSVQPLANTPSGGTSNCQERTSSTYGTYPPDLSGLTIPTKKPPKTSTPSPSYQNSNIQMLPDQTCFDQIISSANPFLYDILISHTDYTSSVDCLSPINSCSIDFTNTRQPKITLLFATPACVSYIGIPSPSNVQQFSYSMYDENGVQINLPGAVDNQGTLLSSSGTNPILQLNQNSCGYSTILQLLTTNDNRPPMRVTISAGGCFKNLSAMTTTIAPVPPPMPPSDVPSSGYQQMPPLIPPSPSNMPPPVFGPSPGFVPPMINSVYFSPPLSPSLSYSPSSVAQQSPVLIQSVPSPIMMAPQQPSQSPSPFQAMRASPILSPPPSPLPAQILVAPQPAPSPILVSSPILPPSSQPASPAVSPVAPIPAPTIRGSPVLSVPVPPQPVYQTMISSPVISAPAPPQPPPSTTLISSPIIQPVPSPPAYQTSVYSPILSPSYSVFPPAMSYASPQIPVPPPAMPDQQYSPPLIYSSPINQAPIIAPPPVILTMPTSPPFIAVTPTNTSTVLSNPMQPAPQVIAPAPPPLQVQPAVPLPQTPQMPVPVPTQQTPAALLNQNATTPSPSTSINLCPQVSLTSHPGVELIVFSDGTNATNDLDPNGNGANLVSTGTIMTILLRNGMPATFSSVGVSSPNVNRIEVALFDEQSNRPLIQSPQGTARSSSILNPSVQDLPMSPAATLAVTFLSTTDGQPPKNVKLLVYACFPTVTEMLSPPPSIIPSPSSSAQYPPQSSSNTPSQQAYFPVNPSVQTYPYNQQYQYSSVSSTNICIDSFQPTLVTSIANTTLPLQYYSSNQCVCICQLGVIVPTSSGFMQYYPPSRTINKRTIREQTSEQHYQTRHDKLPK